METWVGIRSKVLLGLAALALILMTAVICYDVVCRYFLAAPSRWGYEVTNYLMAVAVTFGAAHALSVGAHIRVDALYDRLAGRSRAIADTFAWLSAVIFCTVLTWMLGVLAWRSFRNDAHSMDLNFPLAIPQALVTLGTLALSIEALVLLVSTVRRLRGDFK